MVADMTRRRRSSRSCGGIECQSKAQIAIETAFVEFVEENRSDAGQLGIIEDHAGKDALGDHFDAGFRPDLAVEAHAIAHRLAHSFAQRLGHVAGGGTGRKTARLEHDDLAVAAPWCIEEGKGYARRLAGAGRGHQHCCSIGLQRDKQLGKDSVDGKRIVRARHCHVVAEGDLAGKGCRAVVRTEKCYWAAGPGMPSVTH